MLQVQSYKALSVSESNLSQSMPAHESALIHVAIDTVQFSLTGILPHFKVSSILEHWFSLGILCYHQFVAVELSQEIMVIEVGTRIDERLLSVCLFHEMQELEERVTEFLCRQVTLGFHVYHRQQILIARSALCHEVFQLSLLWNAGTIEMI